MAEYIEREAAIEAVSFYDEEKIRAIPAADVVPVRHGKWIDEPGHIPHCSECGRYSDDAETGEAICCPFCGARMDGDDDV